MKRCFVLIATVLFFTPTLRAQSRPIPAGVRQADQVEAQTQKNIPPPAAPQIKIDPEKLRRDADELAALAA